MVKSPESFGPASPTRQRGGWARLREVEVQSLGWSRVLIVVGVAGFLTGAIDPLEGSIVILTGSVLVARGACCALGPFAWARIFQVLSRRLNRNLLRRVVRRAE